MSPSKILVGQFIIVLSIIVTSIWSATQWAAHSLDYQPALGVAWFELQGVPIYKPWRIFQWWYAYEAYAPDVFAISGAIAASGGVFGIIAAVIGSIWRSRWEKRVTTYGSARWADARDIAKEGLLIPEGVFLGRWRNKYLRHDGPEHVLGIAPTRSGKGVGLVIPTLLSWTGSAIVHDIKGENWELTSGWRSQFCRCYKFNPTDLNSARFNPLAEVRLGASEVRDVQNIADILIDPEGSLKSRDHWDKTAYALLVGVIMHVLYAEEDKTLSGCVRFLSDPSRTIKDTVNLMKTTPHLPCGGTHPSVLQAAGELAKKTDNEASGVLSTAISLLTLYRDPVVAQATSKSDWRIEELLHADRPISVYLSIPPSDISRTKPLIRLMLNQIARRLTERLPGESARKVLLMLDEFPALGRLDFFEEVLAFMAGYGVRAYLIAQSLNQIEKAYGPAHSILDNCHVRIAFGTNDERTARRFSDALGTKTELRSQKNYTGHRLAPWLSHMMVARQETQRPLMTPGEIMQMPRTSQILMISGVPPIECKKLRYYQDRNFQQRVQAPPAQSSRSAIKGEQGIAADRESSASITDASEGTNGEHHTEFKQAEPDRPLEQEVVSKMGKDDGPDASSDQNLETVRKAAALDRTDPGLLPNM
ncbi:MAG: IncP-type conjugal transfer protein TraG [Pseudomonadota bacterium]